MSDEAAIRDLVAAKNRAALGRVWEETGWSPGTSSLDDWRPTKRVSGTIYGVVTYRLELVATDGILGLFVPQDVEAIAPRCEGIPDTPKYFLGHVGWFSGKAEILFSVVTKKHKMKEGEVASLEIKERKVRQPSRKQQLLDSL